MWKSSIMKIPTRLLLPMSPIMETSIIIHGSVGEEPKSRYILPSTMGLAYVNKILGAKATDSIFTKEQYTKFRPRL